MKQPNLNAETLVAHRGLQAKFPENSLQGIQAALALGARAFEIDVQLSSDGVPMLYHDSDMRRISGFEGHVNTLHSSELCTLPAHEPARLGSEFSDQMITPLAELAPLLRQHSDALCFVELKPQSVQHHDSPICRKALESALAGVEHQCIFISFSLSFLREISINTPWRCGLIATDWAQVSSPPLPVDVCFIDRDLLPAQGSLDVDRAPLVVYEITAVEEARELLRRGATMIETHNVELMLASG